MVLGARRQARTGRAGHSRADSCRLVPARVCIARLVPRALDLLGCQSSTALACCAVCQVGQARTRTALKGGGNDVRTAHQTEG
jgi:hypothetical protein